MASIYQRASRLPVQYDTIERRGYAKLKEQHPWLMFGTAALVAGGIVVGLGSIILWSGIHSIGAAQLAGGGCYWLACSLVFAKYRRLAEWRQLATLVDMVRCKALLLRGLKINVLLRMVGFCVALVVTHQVEPRMASPDVWGGWGWVLYKVLATTLAIFMAQHGVGMVCKSLDYNRMRATGRVA